MSNKVCIIGAGVAGLAAGIRLAKDGYEVEIFEKNEKIGGKMYQLELEGFKFDVGPTIVMMPHIFREIFEYAGFNPDDYIPMEKLSPIYNISFNKNENYDVHTDLVEMTNFLETISEKDTAGYFSYLTNTYKRYLNAKDNFIEKSFRSWTDFYNPKTLYKAYKLKTFNNAYNEIAKYVEDDRLRKMISFQTLYIGISPHNGPSIYTIIPMIETIYGVWYIKGGMYSMAKGMGNIFEKLGGKIHLNSNVNEIIIKNKKVLGINLENNEEVLEFDKVISNADFPYTMKELIKEEKNKGKYKNKKIDNMDYSCSVFMMYLGLSRKIEGLKVHNLVFAKDFDKNINDIFTGNTPKDPSIYLYCPTTLDDTLAPEGKEVLYVLVPIPDLKVGKTQWTEDEIEKYKKIIYDKIKENNNLSDIENIVEVEKIFTPGHFNNMFNAYNGSTFGLAPTLKQSNYFRPQPKSKKVKGLYFAGSSVHPGAGVPIVLTNGKLIAQEIYKDDNKRFEMNE